MGFDRPKPSKPQKPTCPGPNTDEMKRIVAQARLADQERMKGYREQSLRIHPWVCGKCGREFTQRNLHLLTVHHKDHNHENNPPDGSNWENLCVYCHENEHRRYLDHEEGGGLTGNTGKAEPVTHKPFAGLGDLLRGSKG
jgi:hypothetical protein